jgi:CBS domain-containing protein
MLIADVMVKDPQYLLTGQTVEHAAQRMLRHGGTLIPVCRSDGSVRGVVTAHEIVTSVAQGRAAPLCPVEDVMNPKFPSCSTLDAADEIYVRMTTEAIPEMVVLTAQGKLAGLIDRVRLVQRTVPSRPTSPRRSRAA